MDSVQLTLLIVVLGGSIFYLISHGTRQGMRDARSTQFVLSWRDFLIAYSQNPSLNHVVRTDLGKIAMALPYLWGEIGNAANQHHAVELIVTDICKKYHLKETDDREKRVLDLIGLATNLIHENNSPTYQQFSAQCV